MAFFDENVLLSSQSAREIYSHISKLPIIDYHCHLDQTQIKADKHFENIGELWLAGDHYKWRAMRLCGVDERYITGDASYKEKFFKYAEILPLLIGNPLYYWTHMELVQIFGISEPLNKNSAKKIWNEANEKLKALSVQKLLEKFNVEYIATTDDPLSTLEDHGVISGVQVRPTFRPDACFASGVDKKTLSQRLDFFISKGCRIADHGFDDFEDTQNVEWLIEECYKKNIILQLHFATFRNINSKAFESIGRDSGFDVFRDSVATDKLAKLLDKMNIKLGGLPKIILYPLNDTCLRSVCAISGAFRNVYVGSAWWFNDTLQGIRRQLETVSEYAALGTNFGMLTDSRSFSSYVRFDFYRRILASYIAEKVDGGEYDKESAIQLAKNIAYYNIKEALGL